MQLFGCWLNQIHPLAFCSHRVHFKPPLISKAYLWLRIGMLRIDYHTFLVLVIVFWDCNLHKRNKYYPFFSCGRDAYENTWVKHCYHGYTPSQSMLHNNNVIIKSFLVMFGSGYVESVDSEERHCHLTERHHKRHRKTPISTSLLGAGWKRLCMTTPL